MYYVLYTSAFRSGACCVCFGVQRFMELFTVQTARLICIIVLLVVGFVLVLLCSDFGLLCETKNLSTPTKHELGREFA